MARQDELLQQIAAASVPHRLGRVYSRYGQPAPVLGDERGALRTLGRDRPKAPQAAGLAGRPGSSQQDARDAEADDIAAKYEDLPDTADEQKAREEQDQHDYEELSDTQRGIVDQYAGTTPGLEDLMHNEPEMSDQHLQNFVQDHARTGVGWEDWLGDYRSEMGKGS